MKTTDIAARFDIPEDRARIVRHLVAERITVDQVPPEMIPETLAELDRMYHPPSDNAARLIACNELLNLHGVEGWSIGIRYGISYANTGDTYAVTVAHVHPDAWTDFLEWTTLADLVEAYDVTEDEDETP